MIFNNMLDNIPYVRDDENDKDFKKRILNIKNDKFSPSSFDYTFCAQKNCKNECSRKMSKRLKDILDKEPRPVSFSYFCGDNK